MTTKFKPMSSFRKNCSDIPNRLVLLMIQDPGKDALYDVVEGTVYPTMGHWYPDKNDPALGSQKPTLPGHWEAVGWNWCQNEFTTNKHVEPVGWAELPQPKKQRVQKK